MRIFMTLLEGLPSIAEWRCCILTLDQAIHQRFSAQDTPVQINGSSHVVEWKCGGCYVMIYAVPTSDTGSVLA